MKTKKNFSTKIILKNFKIGLKQISKKKLSWYLKIKKNNKAQVENIHLEKMKNWTYNKKYGVLSHNSGEFFSIEGKRIKIQIER